MAEFLITDISEDYDRRAVASAIATEQIGLSYGQKRKGIGRVPVDLFDSQPYDGILGALPNRYSNPVGVISYSFRYPNNIVQVMHLAVAPEFRGHGAGSRLIEEVGKIASDHGMTSLSLTSTKSSVGFYLEQGFDQIRPFFFSKDL